MAHIYKGVTSMPEVPNRSGRETLAKRAERISSREEDEKDISRLDIPLSNLAQANLRDSENRIDEVKLEELVLNALDQDNTDWENTDPEYTHAIKTTLEGLKQDKDFSEKKPNIERALTDIDYAEEMRTEMEDEQKEQAESARVAQQDAIEAVRSVVDGITGKKEEADDAESLRMIEQLSHEIDAKRLAVDNLSFTKGFFGRLFSTELRGMNRELAQMEIQLDALTSQLAETIGGSTARSSVISPGAQRERTTQRAQDEEKTQKRAQR